MRNFPPVPARIAALDRHSSGFPIPWFVMRPATGTVDFRITDPTRRVQALKQRRCWVCGQVMGRYVAFLGGPLSTAQRIYADLPSHRDCAEFAVQVCPFMACPTMQRRDDIPADVTVIPGTAMANPEVMALAITVSYHADVVVHAGEPRELQWYHAGRVATRAEVESAIQAARRRDEVVNHPRRDAICRMLDTLPLPG